MLSGDNEAVTRHVARAVGLPEEPLLSGPQIAGMDPATLQRQAADASLFVKLTPQQKALYDTVRVAEYDTSGLAADGPDSVRQTAQISLIVKSSQRVYGVLDHQTWRWDAAAKRWWLETGLPDISPQQ